MTDPTLMFRALELAARWHEGQLRKHPMERIPYIAHPATVGILLARAGFDDEVVAAGALHDVIEDCGVSEADIAKELTPRVAKLVAWTTHPMDISSYDARTEAFFEQLSHAPKEALAIKCADHIANLNSIALSAKSMDSVWTMFHASRDKKLAYEHRMLDLVASAVPDWMSQLQADALRKVETLS